DRAGVGLAARQARPDLGGQRFGHLPAGVVAQRGRTQFRGGRQRGVRDGGGLLRGRRRGKGEGRGEGKQQGSEAHAILRRGARERPQLNKRGPPHFVPQVMPRSAAAQAVADLAQQQDFLRRRRRRRFRGFLLLAQAVVGAQEQEHHQR